MTDIFLLVKYSITELMYTILYILINRCLDSLILGESAVITGHHLTSFEVMNDQVLGNFENRQTGEAVGTYQVDFMIVADGIHSVVRKHYYPNCGRLGT